MSFEEVARGILSLEVKINEGQLSAEANKAAAQVNKAMQQNIARNKALDTTSQLAAVEALSKAFGGVGANIPIKQLNAFQQSMNRSTASVNNFFRTSSTGARNMQAGFSTLNQVIAARLPSSLQTATRAMSSFAGSSAGAIGAINSQVTALGSKFSGIGNAGAAAFAVIGTAALTLGQQFAQTAMDFQSLEVSLTAIISNSDTANTTTERFIANLRELALASGFSSNTLANTGRQFLALGFSGQKTNTILETFAKGAAGVGASNEQLRLALAGVAQIASKGAVSMEELRRQIAENLPGAVNLTVFFENLGKEMGVTTEEARKLQEQGLAPAEEGINALITTINEAPATAGAFEARLNTLSGQLGVLKESFTQTVQDGFRPFLDALAPMFKEMATGTGVFDSVKPAIESLGKTLGETLRDVLKEIIPLIPGLANMFAALVKAAAPLIVEIVKVGASLAKILIPVITFAAKTIEFLLTKLGPVSAILRAVFAGAVIGKVIKSIQLVANLIGRFGSGVNTVSTAIARFAAPAARLVTSVGLIRQIFNLALGPIREFIGLLNRIPGVGLIKNAVGAIAGVFGGGDASTGGSLGKGFGVIGKAIDDVKDKMGDFNVSTKFDMGDAIDKVNDKFEDLIKAADKTRDAVADVAKANADYKKATEDLEDLENERLDVLEDTASALREIEEAQDDLVKIGFRLRDIEQERLQILEDIKELNTPATADELAAADLKIEKATNALNKAKMKEQELLDSLNKKQRRSINLRGLSLDQLRTTLSNVRASLDASKRQEEELNPGGKTDEEIQAELIDARIEVKEAELEIKEAVADRLELDNRVLNNATKLREKNEDLLDLELDKKDALRDQATAQETLNGLLAGGTTQATALKDIEDKITTAKQAQQTAQQAIQTAQQAVKVATIEQQIEEAKITGNVNRQHELEIQLLGLKTQGLGISRLVTAELNGQIGTLQLQQSIMSRQKQITSDTGNILAGLTSAPVVLGGGTKAENAIRALTEAIVVTPAFIAAARRDTGNILSGYADGGLITMPHVARVGEGFKHELMLPLSKPDRVWSLMSQHLPKYPGALRAAQEALGGPGPSPALTKAVSSLRTSGSGNGGVSHFERDLLTEMRIMNERLEKISKQDPNVSVSVAQKSNDELLRKQILRDVARMLAERRR